MRSLILAIVMATACVAQAQVPVVIIVSAQEHAEHLARTNTFGHCGRRGGVYEGIGFSSVSAEDAMRRSCFWGQRRVREIGTAWSPVRRGWVAVVRYW